MPFQYREVRDTRRLIWPLAFLAIGPAILGLLTLAVHPGIAVLTGVSVAVVIRGTSKTVPTDDPTLAVKVRHRPLWMRVTFAAMLALAMVWRWGPDGWTASLAGMVVVTSPLFLAAIALVMRPEVAALIKGKRAGRKSAPSAAPLTPEQAESAEITQTLARGTGQIFYMAGLTWRSPQTGLDVLPRIVGRGEDKRRRPYLDVEPIAGRQTVASFEKRADEIAGAWGVPRIEVDRPDPARHTVRLTAVLRESRLTGPVLWAPADVNRPVAEYVKALPMGANVSTGDAWHLSLSEQNFIIGGQAGAGKSSFANGLLAHLARHPDVRLAMVDLKNGAEAAPWKPRADLVLTNGAEESEEESVRRVLDLVDRSILDMKRRYARMIEAGVSNAWTEGFLGPDEPLKLLVIDECSELFKVDTPERRAMTDRMITSLKTYIQQGRAAGYVLAMSTQFPKEENLPNSIRQVASAAVAFSVKDGTGTRAILGSDFYPPSPDMDPAQIAKSQQGQAVLVDEQGDTRRVQMSWLDKDGKLSVVAESAHLKSSWYDEQDTAPVPEQDTDPVPEQDTAPALDPAPKRTPAYKLDL